MRPARFDELTRALARTRRRRDVLALAVKGIGVGLAGGLVDWAPGTAASTATACAGDWPTASSLEAAAAAVTAGARNVALSPGGCVRLRRTLARGLRETIITFDGLTARRTLQLAGGAIVLEEHATLGMRASARITYPPVSRTPYVVTREELDQTTGAVTERVTTTVSASSVHVEISRPDSTGAFVPFSVYDESVDQESGGRPAARATRGVATAASCSAAQQNYIKGLFDLATDTGLLCLNKYKDTTLAALISDIITTRGIAITCSPIPNPNHPNALAWVPGDSWSTWGSNLHIILPPAFFIVDGTEAMAALFHEMLHARMGWQHNPDEEHFSRRTEADPVYACTSLCFALDGQNPAPPTRCTCAKCLETNKCDSRCTSLADCDPGVSFQCPCTAGPNAYKRFGTCSECLQVCPSGLSCFGIEFCDEVGEISCGQPITCP